MNPERKRTVVLYGTSLFIAGLAIELEERPDLHVIPVDDTLYDPVEQCRVLNPDVLISELDASHAHFIITMLQQHSQLVLIGLDPSSNTVTVLVNQRIPVTTVHELADVIWWATREQEQQGSQFKMQISRTY